jgi:hypothetical protein
MDYLNIDNYLKDLLKNVKEWSKNEQNIYANNNELVGLNNIYYNKLSESDKKIIDITFSHVSLNYQKIPQLQTFYIEGLLWEQEFKRKKKKIVRNVINLIMRLYAMLKMPPNKDLIKLSINPDLLPIELPIELPVELLDDVPLKSTNILFMFLGGLPAYNDLHYNEFYKTTDDTFYIVVHPMELNKQFYDNINASEFYKKMLVDGRLLIVDNDHHVKTQWATFSLVAATLLMIQYALKTKGDIYKKFVLISSADIPIYNYKVIHKELNSDNKSWFNWSEEGIRRSHIIMTYKYEGGMFNTDDISHVSQWMTLDTQHIKYFIDKTKTDFVTYKKVGDIKCNKIVGHIQAIDEKSIYANALLSFVGKSGKLDFTYELLEQTIKNGFCISVDEAYFGAVLKHYLGNDNFLSNIKNVKIAKLDSYNAHEYITPLLDEDNYLTTNKTIFHNWIQNNAHATNYRTWYGAEPAFGQDEFIIYVYKNINPASDGHDKYFIIKDKKIIKLSQMQYDQLYKEKKYYFDTLIGGDPERGSDAKSYSKITFGNPNKKVFNDIYTVSSTYTDWSCVNANPANMFRNFKSNHFSIDGDVMYSFEKDNIPIIQIINEVEPDYIFNHYLHTDRKNKTVYDNYIDGPSFHPMEYCLFTLKSIINAYNFITKLELNNKKMTNLYFYTHIEAHNIYKNIIDNEIDFLEEKILDGKTYYIFKSGVSENDKNKLFGHPITSFSLNNALAYGALFIRKNTPMSNIEKYSTQLMNLSQYVHRNYLSYKLRDNKYKDNDSVIFTIPGFKHKYLKYKQKYQKLKLLLHKL